MFAEYWDYLDLLIAESRIVIDRPRGTAHPSYPNLIYPLDYGYLDGTRAVDGGGIDLFRGTLPDLSLDAIALSVDLVKRDAEVKLILGCTEVEIRAVLDFLNGAGMRACLVRRAGVLGWLRSRRSVRRFQAKPISRSILETLIETATYAPSAHHRQPWRFVVLTGAAEKTRLADSLAADLARDLAADGQAAEEVAAQVRRSRERIGAAPAVILLCLDVRGEDEYPDSHRREAERLMGVQSAALAGGQLLLAAHAVGLSGVWMCAPLFAPGTVREALALPESWHPQALILIGFAEKFPPERPRKRLDEIAVFID